MSQLFDSWPDPYEQWFHTPIGALVKATELDLMLKLVQPQQGETILDAGCGSGIFTQSLTATGSRVTGSDISEPMLNRARQRIQGQSFLAADICKLPFADNHFDKTILNTALEFIEDGQQAIAELFRVTKPGGTIVIATLNHLSPWATRRSDTARKDKDSVFNHATFRSPEELLKLAPIAGKAYTAVHFAKDCDPELAPAIERQGQAADLDTGAFLIACWRKP